MNTLLERFFKLKQYQTSISREIFAGTITFLTMAYIIFVNPNILGDTGMDKGALITATILASAFATILTGLWANAPIGMAPGMGLNAFFAYTLVAGQAVSWQTALGVVFISGFAFFILTIIGVRKWILDAIPLSLRFGMGAGIGVFITFVGLQSLTLIVNDPVTFVTLGKASIPLLLGLIGLVCIITLELLSFRGALLVGILVTTVLGMIFGQIEPPKTFVALPPSLAPLLLELDILSALKWGLVGTIFSFMFIDLFDSLGTVVACAYEAEMVDEKGNIRNFDRILSADAIGTMVGAVLGTSTTTAYVESASGISMGGRTGLTSITTGVFFLLALFVTPFIAIVPLFATAPALIIVGVYMFRNVGRIDFTKFEEALPAFFTIFLMPFTYSISLGLCFGFISYILAATISGNIKKIHPVMWVIGIFSALEIYLKMM